MKNYINLLTDIQNNILYLTINREEKLNALNKDTLAEIHDCLIAVLNNDLIKGIIITGKGEKAFVAGADIKEFSDFNEEQGKNLAKEGQTKVFDLIANCKKPVIAAINGFALGGGLELAMACHIRIASQNAKLGLPEVSLGLIPGYGGTQRLTELVGKGKAFEMILTADMVSAEEAAKIGLINHTVVSTDLLPQATAMMEKILSRSPEAIAAALKAINAFNHSQSGYDAEIQAFGNCFSSQNFKEGVTAFLEKRKPKFY
ncbi:enoyl-CoA hydratase/isomerase family protein [Pedobacter glucosidilyticus]|uniref:enoyl-CoA hydratase/isomerase family protein n=1 Tax=Pedobacter glucosidilyticus TaxID=1122941 RepID=UPI0003FE21E3|nr:enoyl-CoA hydratase-related protein [Pedobacter glucosidilyticus]